MNILGVPLRLIELKIKVIYERGHDDYGWCNHLCAGITSARCLTATTTVPAIMENAHAHRATPGSSAKKVSTSTGVSRIFVGGRGSQLKVGRGRGVICCFYQAFDLKEEGDGASPDPPFLNAPVCDGVLRFFFNPSHNKIKRNERNICQFLESIEAIERIFLFRFQMMVEKSWIGCFKKRLRDRHCRIILNCPIIQFNELMPSCVLILSLEPLLILAFMNKHY